ncbi:MAG: sigma-54 dependent transcriptional regulator [Desulfobulbaceae bacterium]|nr:sigma-54 dependent transcriptional regulator [Desulfobulbaceae bacterium]HIJ78787.1 sigma-54-dependent Fis family transcriptional regulator [Deltaproteobacteria bacterium]
MENNISILVVDDDQITRQTLSMSLEDDYNTFTAENGREALEILGREEIDLVLSDLDMPTMSGLELLAEINNLENSLPVIFITGQGTIETAVQAMKMGAYDYITKPVNVDRLMLVIEKTLENKRLKEENIFLKKRIKESQPDLNLVGNSPEMRRITELATQIGATKATVLIEGESGTGKELITNVIHYSSPVAHGPFIKVNCSAFAEGVLESELFGHEKGAFTGAVSTKKGRFELADGGTLFLDEIGDMPMSIQVKMLRFLQEKTFERVGGSKTFKVDIRIISATNKNLEQLVKEEKFREDLYYRLRVVKLEMPPLRRRREDIRPLVENYIRKFSDLHGKPISGITDEVLQLMKDYNWPGNIRELINCIESAVVMSRSGVIDIESIPEYLTYKTVDIDTDMEGGLLQQLERNAITEVLNETGGDKTKTAKRLGIGLRTLYRKIEKYGLED